MDAVNSAERIATAARRLVEKGGPETVTMRRVARAVGITPMAIYHHYPGRASLLNAVADRGFEDLAAELRGRRLKGDLEARLAQLLDIYLEHALANPRLFELMFLAKRRGARRYPQDFKARRSPTANPTADVLAEGMETGVFSHADPWEITLEIGALGQGLILLYLGGRLDVSPDEFRALYRRAIQRYIHGIVP